MTGSGVQRSSSRRPRAPALVDVSGTMVTMIRLVVSDLDGTLWDRDLVVPTAHLQAIDALSGSDEDFCGILSQDRDQYEHRGSGSRNPLRTAADRSKTVDHRLRCSADGVVPGHRW